MPTASARGNITLETPALASLVGPDDVVRAPTGNDAHLVTGLLADGVCKKRRASETPVSVTGPARRRMSGWGKQQGRATACATPERKGDDEDIHEH